MYKYQVSFKAQGKNPVIIYKGIKYLKEAKLKAKAICKDSCLEQGQDDIVIISENRIMIPNPVLGYYYKTFKHAPKWQKVYDQFLFVIGKYDNGITLNDKPAKIIHYSLKFPLVEQVDSGLSCEFAKETIIHVLKTRDGKFKS